MDQVQQKGWLMNGCAILDGVTFDEEDGSLLGRSIAEHNRPVIKVRNSNATLVCILDGKSQSILI